MKELSIEEKAKAYDIALEKIEMLLGTGSSCSREELEYVFPELAESEDERMKEAIIATIHLYYGEPLEDEAKEMIAWLEKQAEKKPDNWLQELEDKLANATPKQLAEWKEKYFKEEPAEWSEEDEEISSAIVKRLEGSCALSVDLQSAICWVENVKDRVQPQPKQEWSEEDEENFARVDYACLKVYGGDSYSSDWLRKFLGIHKKWKPSERQLECLGYAIEKAEKDWSPLINNRIYLTLKALKEQLKELKEE